MPPALEASRRSLSTETRSSLVYRWALLLLDSDEVDVDYTHTKLQAKINALSAYFEELNTFYMGGLQSKGALNSLMQQTLASTQQKKKTTTSLVMDEIPEITFMQVVQKGIRKEMPVLQIRYWNFNEECI